MIEAMRLAFADAREFVADPKTSHLDYNRILSKSYAAERRNLIRRDMVSPAAAGSPFSSSDTVQFCCVDEDGNACSMINSNYMGFGTGIVPVSCGFTLQNRGHNFSLKKGHYNALAPRKKPYHTIIPGLALQNEEFHCAFGVMGGFMQPQGHMQVLSNMIDFDMSPQAAKPRNPIY
jgi:gamma-glutamyltranspeptidase / glutathione hydrolase